MSSLLVEVAGEEGAEDELCGDGVRLRLRAAGSGLDLVEAVVTARLRFLPAPLAEAVAVGGLDLDVDLPGRGREKEGRARFVGGIVAARWGWSWSDVTDRRLFHRCGEVGVS